MNKMIIRPIGIAVTPGTSVNITIPEIYLRNGKIDTLLFELTEPQRVIFLTREGNEPVTIINGVGGTTIALETSSANRFFSDRLFLGFKYRLKYGNDGAAISDNTAGAVEHFINLNTPNFAKPYNPQGLTTPPPTA